MNLIVIIMFWSDVEIQKVRVCASLGIVSLWFQLFLWFRLFDSLAQYVDLIWETIKDIRFFIYVLLALMLTFGSGLFMLQINRVTLPLYDSEPIY